MSRMRDWQISVVVVAAGLLAWLWWTELTVQRDAPLESMLLADPKLPPQDEVDLADHPEVVRSEGAHREGPRNESPAPDPLLPGPGEEGAEVVKGSSTEQSPSKARREACAPGDPLCGED